MDAKRRLEVLGNKIEALEDEIADLEQQQAIQWHQLTWALREMRSRFSEKGWLLEVKGELGMSLRRANWLVVSAERLGRFPTMQQMLDEYRKADRLGFIDNS